MSEFPKEIIHNRSTYLEYLAKSNSIRFSETDPKDRNECHGKCACSAVIKEMSENYEKCENSLIKLREHVSQIEQAFGDQLKEIYRKLGIRESGFNGLNSKDSGDVIDANKDVTVIEKSQTECQSNDRDNDRQSVGRNARISYAQVTSPKERRGQTDIGLFTTEEPSLSQLLSDTPDQRTGNGANTQPRDDPAPAPSLSRLSGDIPCAQPGSHMHSVVTDSRDPATSASRGSVSSESNDDDDPDVIIISDTNQKGIQTEKPHNKNRNKKQNKSANENVNKKDSNVTVKFAGY